MQKLNQRKITGEFFFAYVLFLFYTILGTYLLYATILDIRHHYSITVRRT